MRERLRSERCKKNWTQAYVAAQIGITTRNYQNYEYGERTPSLEVANRLEDLFGVPQRELLVRHCTADFAQTESEVLQNISV